MEVEKDWLCILFYTLSLASSTYIEPLSADLCVCHLCRSISLYISRAVYIETTIDYIECVLLGMRYVVDRKKRKIKMPHNRRTYHVPRALRVSSSLLL